MVGRLVPHDQEAEGICRGRKIDKCSVVRGHANRIAPPKETELFLHGHIRSYPPCREVGRYSL